MRFFLFAMLSLWVGATYGQSVFECKQHDGVTAYQDHPCPGAPNAPPAIKIKPSYGHDTDAASKLSPQQRAQLIRAMGRLRAAIQKLDAKRPALPHHESQ